MKMRTDVLWEPDKTDEHDRLLSRSLKSLMFSSPRHAGARTWNARQVPPSRPAWIHPDMGRAPWFEHCE